MSKDKDGKVPATKVKISKYVNWTKSQKALYQEHMADIQGKAQLAAQQVLTLGNKILARSLDDFGEELGIAEDGNDYDTDAQKFRFVRREKEEGETPK